MHIKIDGVTIEVMKNALQSIAEEMGVTLIRTALSTNIKDRMDCSTAIYTRSGKLVAQAEHIPLHLGLMPSVVEEVLKIYPSHELQEGDAILINDPYISGSHLPDVFLISPVFFEGELVAIIGNIAHHVDVGGMTPGSMSVQATEIFQEGLRLPAVRIRKAGVLDQEIIRLLTANVRTGKECLGDLYAQIAANNVGEHRLKELIARYKVQYTNECMEEIMNYSERRMRSAIRKIPNGVFTFEDFLEGDGTVEKPIKISVQITIEDEEVLVNFKGTDQQARGPINSTLGVTKACVYYAIKSFFDSEVPPNAGAYRSIKVIAPKGTIVNPRFPAAVSNANINTSQRITDVILGALSSVDPNRAMAACSGTMNLFTIGGIDEKTNQYYSYVETYGGGQGAVLGLDGMDGVHTNMTNTRNAPAEVIEQSYPLTVKRYALADNSGGHGKYRGGMGMIREIVIESDDAAVTLSTERNKNGPWGLYGGGKGGTSQCLLILPDGKQTNLPSKVTTRVHKGSILVLKTSGGGGYMDPLERDPQEVQKDVIAGNITLDTARKEYGVMLDPECLIINFVETTKLRSLIKGNYKV
jgi:N-methylhydantoinase B